jgi:RNA recognition motif-containing protein
MINPLRVFIANLNYQIDDSELFEFLHGYADLKSVRIVRHPDGSSRGFAFVEAASAADVTVILQLNGAGLRGRNLFVERVKRKTKTGVDANG